MHAKYIKAGLSIKNIYITALQYSGVHHRTVYYSRVFHDRVCYGRLCCDGRAYNRLYIMADIQRPTYNVRYTAVDV